MKSKSAIRMSENVPKRFRVLFWDVEFSTLNIPEHSWFIIERILEYGDAADLFERPATPELQGFLDKVLRY